MSAPAYTQVTARRTLNPVPTAMVPDPPLPQKPQPRKIDWPQPVRDYVQRAFAPDLTPKVDKAEVQAMLKKVITDAAENNKLDVIDWEHHPLPHELIVIEKTQQAQQAQPAPWLANYQAPAATHTNHYTAAPQAVSPQTNGHLSRKRKSWEPDTPESADTKTVPWREPNGVVPGNYQGARSSFEERITYANQAQSNRLEKRQRKNDTRKYQADLEKRRQRFGHQLGSPSPVSDDTPMNDGPIVGTCQTLEKKYFRLTAPPKPENVRPQHILEETLELLKKKWRKEGNYGYICDQFKSLRQDLTVQHIKNDFTVTVYEIHARIALEKGDLGEYNQCQTQLRALYSQNLGGHPAEFLAYRILYYIHMHDRTGMNDVLADLTAADKQQPAVKHALEVRSALALGNYHKFFRLYVDTPNMGAYLMDMFIVRERLAALANISKAYKPEVKIRFLTDELGFDSDQDCWQFLYVHGAHEFVGEKGETVVVATGKIGAFLENAKNAAFSKVDIKGQI